MSDVNSILDTLKNMFPDAGTELVFDTPWQLLVAVVLSAQCTDKRVNIITEKLFRDFQTPADFAEMSEETLKKYIFSCGFYNNKARNIIAAARDVVARFNGEVPQSREELETLSGVGRKSANVIFAVAFGGQAMPVDTHVFRVSNRIGLSNSNNVEACERQLVRIIPHERLSEAHHLLLHLGRYICKSRRPDCQNCGIINQCTFGRGLTRVR